jgi:hypothetical protein
MNMLFYRRKEAGVRLLDYEPFLLMTEEQAARERGKAAN